MPWWGSLAVKDCFFLQLDEEGLLKWGDESPTPSASEALFEVMGL